MDFINTLADHMSTVNKMCAAHANPAPPSPPTKTISNGFAMAAVIGRADIMAPAAESFISTSYHTERVGPAAALAAIKKMRSHNTIEHNCATGRAIKQSVQFPRLRKSNSAERQV